MGQSRLYQACLGFLALFMTATALPGPEVLPATPVRNSLPSENLNIRQDTCTFHGPVIATFYTSGTDPNQVTACGNVYDPQSLSVAICTPQIPDAQQYCNQTMSVQLDSGGPQIQVTIDDTDATCNPDYAPYQLDLSLAAWTSLAGPSVPTSVGTLTVDFMVVATPCY